MTRQKRKADRRKAAMITAKELASVLGVCENTPVNWRKNGVGPRFLRVGPRNIRYRSEDVEAWLQRGEKAQ